MSGVVRVPSHVHLEAKRIAALRGQQPGEALAEAWREYVENHRAEFAADLEEAARLIRAGTLEDLAAFVIRHTRERAELSVPAARDERVGRAT
jgi:hypothetical protein